MKRIGSRSTLGPRWSKSFDGPVLAIALFIVAPAIQAQWLNQSIDLKAGWNAVFLHVDASHRTLNAAVGGDAANPIQEIWRWNPPPVAQFTDNPAQPTATVDWTAWNRTNAASPLQRLSGDTAYLVRVSSNAAPYVWDVRGKPVPPRPTWSVSGLNLIGFPVVPTAPPTFSSFLANAPELQSVTPEIYRYLGGNLGATNPVVLASPMFPVATVQRGQAYWMRSGTVFNRYFGPFEVLLSSANGIDFGETSGSSSFRLRNHTTNVLNVRLLLQSSATPPATQPAIAGEPPLLIREAIQPSTLTYGYSNLVSGVVRAWRLEPRDQPGSEVEVVLGVNRAAMTQAPGTLLAGVLRFTESLGHTMVHVPVSATVASSAGLWVGDASVQQVAHYLKTYQRTPDQTPVTTASGNYVVTGVDTSFGPVPRPYPLRLIVHNPTNGPSASLIQRVYYGLDAATNAVAATGESALHPAFLKNARRISAPHLPWTEGNTVWPLNGKLGQQTLLSTTVSVAYHDQASNPFLHTYHPDHDNRTATFDAIQPQGAESYAIERAITLEVQPPGNDFASLVNAGTSLRGEYRETLTLKGLSRASGATDSRPLQVRGSFQLNRISDIPVLTLAP
jgi:hypothetical protein